MTAEKMLAPRGPESRPIGVRLVTIPLTHDFQPSPVQTRPAFNPEQNEEDQALLDSLKQHGQLTPVTLETQGTGYRIIDGHRRIAALLTLKIPTVLAIVRQASTQLQADLDTLTANVRQNMAPSQLARQIVLIRDRHQLTWEQIAAGAGLTRQHVHNLVKFTQLPPELQAQVELKHLSLKAALALGHAPAEQQPELAKLAAQNDLSEAEAGRAVALLQGGKTPGQIAAELGLEPARETAASSPTAAPAETLQPRRKTAVGRRPTRALNAKSAGTLLKTYFPTAPAREIQAITQALADQTVTPKRLKLIGLLRVSGLTAEEVPANVEELPGSRDILNLLEAVNTLRQAAAEDKCAPEFLVSLRLMARSLSNLKPAKES